MRGWPYRPVVVMALLSIILGGIPPAAGAPVPTTAPHPIATLSGPADPATPVRVESPPVPHPQHPPPNLPAAAPPAQTPDLHQLPLAFVPNQGQAPAAVRFQVRALGGTAFLTDDALVLTLPAARPPDPPRDPLPRPGTPARQVPQRALRIAFLGANPTVAPRGEAARPSTTSYLLGNNPSRWRHALPTYAGVVVPALYPSIDLRYTGDGSQLKRTYTLAAGADSSRIRWRYTGAQELRLGASGQLSVTLPLPAPSPTSTAVLTPSTLVEQAPVAWQDVGGRRVPVAVRYSINQDQSVGFALGAYDRTRPLMIDPTLTYGSYLGGTVEEFGRGIAVDPLGQVYVVGTTFSTDFPTINPLQAACTLHPVWGSCRDVFVTKLNATGSAALYSTYIGSQEEDWGFGIAVDAAGYAYVTGYAGTSDFFHDAGCLADHVCLPVCL